MKARAILFKPGTNLIRETADLLLSDGRALENKLVVFPGKRPGHFLRQEIARRLGRPFRPPSILSMDGLADFICERSGAGELKVSDLDSLAILYRLHREAPGPGNLLPLSLEEFLPWGFRLLSDLENLKIERVSPRSLEGVGQVFGADMPGTLKILLGGIHRLYEDFYCKLKDSSLSTRSSRYSLAAESIGALHLPDIEQIIMAGLYRLTRSEREIISALGEREKVVFLFQDGPGMAEILKELKVTPEEPEGTAENPRFFFQQAADVHGEVLGLKEALKGEPPPDQGQVIVLPEPRTLFPLVQQVLPGVLEYNISMGYPLLRTPIYALLETLARVLEGEEKGLFSLPGYLDLVLHPYVKNLKLGESSTAARILWHTVEEELAPRGASFISLEEIEDSSALTSACLARLARADEKSVTPEVLKEYFLKIHRVLLRSFAHVSSLADFSRNLSEVVSFLAEESSASQHPYSGRFLKSMLGALEELGESLIGEERLPGIRDLFGLLRSFLATVRVPFEGTPLKGLQVLGFLEARNLLFKKVFFLDLNEGVLPDGARSDSLLPIPLRRHLGLSTCREREELERYLFHTLVRSAEEAHFFFAESNEKEKSRLAEELIWEEQQKERTLHLERLDNIYFKADFSQDEVEAIPKSPEVVRHLENFTSSASALDDYLSCPLKFYYHRVLRLQERDTAHEGLKADERGEMVHAVLNRFFSGRTNQDLLIEDKDFEEIPRLVEEAFEERYGLHLPGRLILAKFQIKTRMEDVLRLHQKDPWRSSIILACELNANTVLNLGKGLRIRAKGRLDRVDRRGEEIVILDYKTGSQADLPRKDKFLSSSRQDWPKTLRSVQLPFYILLYLAVHREVPADKVNASLMFLGRKAIQETFLWKDERDRRKTLLSYREAINTLVQEIRRPDLPFTPASLPAQTCPACDFKVMCGRQWLMKNI
ncbi:MAG: PD-(D/E)XK nuclease family protein [bacterium]